MGVIALLISSLVGLSQNASTPGPATSAISPAAAAAPSLGESSQRPLSLLQTLEPADQRLVTQPRPLKGAISLLCRLLPKRFLLHDGSLDANGNAVLAPGPSAAMGLLAQETVKVVPEAVYRPIDDAREFWMMDYEVLVPLLVAGIQEQQSDIRSQKLKLDELEEKIRRLEDQNQRLWGKVEELHHISEVIDSSTRSAVKGLRSDIKAVATRVSTLESKTSCSCSK